MSATTPEHASPSTLTSLLNDLNKRNLGPSNTNKADDADDSSAGGEGRPKRRAEELLRLPVILPDLRYEEGVLVSIRSCLHPLVARESQEALGEASKEGVELRDDEAGRDELSDLIKQGVRIEWGQMTYILARDQILFPLVQGVLWGVAGMWVTNFWQYRKALRASTSTTPSAGAVSPSSSRTSVSALDHIKELWRKISVN